MELEFEIDKITESIESAETGERFDTLVLPAGEADLRGVTKKNGWLFDWKLELAKKRQVYKLVTEKEPDVIQGLASFKKEEDHIHMILIENAPANLGKGKKYIGVAGNLIAYGCKLSQEAGFNGAVGFESKTLLVDYYKSIGATHISGQKMAFLGETSKSYIDKYFPQRKKGGEL
jgi:hypothetical protein